MSITLDVNAFLNQDVCTTGCDDIVMEKEMETNIFDEIEHLLKFNKNLEFENQHKKEAAEEEPRKKKVVVEDGKNKDALNLDFLNTTSDDFLLTSDSQSLLGEDTLLFTVEQDRLQPVSSRFMVPGIYKRIEGVATNETRTEVRKSNVFISDLEKRGRIVTQAEFERLYRQTEETETNPPLRRVILLQPLESDDEEVAPDCPEELDVVVQKENSLKDKIPKEWDALNRLAYDILKLTNRDHIVIDRKKNEIVRTQFHTHQKTIYRFLSPEILGLKPPAEGEANVIDLEEELKFQMNQKTVNKLGRPRKRLSEDKIVKKSSKMLKKPETPKTNTTDNKAATKINTRTRSGRLVKAPNNVQENTNILLPPPSPQESLTTLLNDLKDSDYQCSKLNTTQPVANESVTPMETSQEGQQSPKRKIPPEAICPTCKKIFLGKRLQRHFAQHPEHMQIPQNSTTPTQTTNNSELTAPSEEMSLFRFLISKLQKSQTLNEDQKADLFLNELNDLVEQLQLRSSRLIRNTSGLHFVNQRCSKLLGIPEGQYALDLTAIEAPLDPELTNQYDNSHPHSHQLSQPTNISTRSLDYTNLSITLDDTLTDEAAQKLNLSAGGKLLPPSEESLLRAVDDLVQTDINKIHASSMLQQQPIASTSCLSASSNTTSVVAKHLPPHIDHASDNAVEAVHMKETTTTVNNSETPLLDLSVDFFQFNN